MKITKTTKSILFYLVCIIAILYTMPIFASNTNNINLPLREILSNNDTSRLSGKGAYIRTVYRKAINANDFMEDEEFKDEQSKQQYLRLMRITKGLDFSLKQDKITYTLEKLYYDQDKNRRDYISLSPVEAESIRKKPSLINTLSLKTFTFDGDKMISLVNPERPNGTIDNYANILPGKMYFPKFQHFGLNDSKTSQRLIDAMNQGTAAVEQSTIDGQVHASLEMANGALEMKFIFDSAKEMSRLYTGIYVNGQLQQETICLNYAQTDGGEWFPRVYTLNKYAYVKGEITLTFSEEFEAIPDTINFNIPIESSIFSPKLSEGTHIIDDRYSPPLEYIIESPSLEVFLEPLSREETISHVPENLVQNNDSKELNNSDVASKVGVNTHKSLICKVFIPETNTAIEHRKPFIFDLSSGKLILIFVSKGNILEKSHNSLTKLGKGDIAWDGSLVTVRKTKALTVFQESHRPLKCTVGEYRNSYSLPNKVDLPYSMLIVTSESEYYFVTIYKISPDGIWITYRKLSDDEAKHYCVKR